MPWTPVLNIEDSNSEGNRAGETVGEAAVVKCFCESGEEDSRGGCRSSAGESVEDGGDGD